MVAIYRANGYHDPRRMIFMTSFIKFSVSKNERRAWNNYIKRLPNDVHPTKVGENDFYEFYEILIDTDVQRRIWNAVIASTGLKGIYPTTHTFVDGCNDH